MVPAPEGWKVSGVGVGEALAWGESRACPLEPGFPTGSPLASLTYRIPTVNEDLLPQ